MEWAGLEGLQNPAESPKSSLMKSFSGFKRQLAQSSQFVPKWDRSRQKNEQLSESLQIHFAPSLLSCRTPCEQSKQRPQFRTDI